MLDILRKMRSQGVGNYEEDGILRIWIFGGGWDA
jgi:hypothetical protein